MEAPPKHAVEPRNPPDEDVAARIARCKRRLGADVLILAHHYQRDAVVAVADHVGDSLRLSQLAAAATAPYIVFCGVHFMPSRFSCSQISAVRRHCQTIAL